MLYSGCYPVRYTTPSTVGMSYLFWATWTLWDGGEERPLQDFWRGNLRERDHLGDPSVDGRIILNRSSGSGIWVYGLDRAGSGQGQLAGTCECGNEHSVRIKCGEFLDWLNLLAPELLFLILAHSVDKM